MRANYIISRHSIIQEYRQNMLTKTEVTQKLEELKNSLVISSCNGIDVCMKALFYCIDKGLLPLSGSREKFAMDIQNPYSSIVPSMRLAIKSVVTGAGREMVNRAAMNKGSMSYWAQNLPAAAKGETPNMTNIKLAFNTFSEMRENKMYSSIADFAQNCRADARNKSKNIKRKIAMMNVATVIDPYLAYLGLVHDRTLGTPG